MPGWREEYLANIQEAERNNPVNRDLVEACSQLADRIAVLEAERTASRLAQSQPPTPSRDPPSDADPPAAAARLRLELAEALRSKGQLEARLRAADADAARLRARLAELRTVAAARRALEVRLRDREDELRQKSKLVADVQDELAVLNLQLDVAERERAKAQAETRQLVDRWMRKVGEEADEMNRANEPALSRNL